MALSNLKVAEGVKVQKVVDRVGGSSAIPSGIYKMKLEYLYSDVAKSGAIMMYGQAILEDGTKYRISECVASGDAKGNKVTYTKDGIEHYLPGYTTINNICLLTVGEPIDSCQEEEKVLDLYDSELQKTASRKVMCIKGIAKIDINLGIMREIVNKQVKSGDKGNKYINTNETRTINTINCVFRGNDNLTVIEIKAGAETSKFFDVWNDANKDRDANRFVEVKGAVAGSKSKGTSMFSAKK